MQSSIQHSSVHEIIKEPPRHPVEWNESKIPERLNTDPEATAIVSEKVFGQGNVIGDW
jgi:hypothetical protein